MVTKPRSREDHRGWFSILRQGKKSFIEALQNQENAKIGKTEMQQKLMQIKQTHITNNKKYKQL